VTEVSCSTSTLSSVSRCGIQTHGILQNQHIGAFCGCADVAHQVKQLKQTQSALKKAQEQLALQQTKAAEAEAAMKAAQAEAAAAAESMKLEQETGAQCTEEAMCVMTAVEVQLQEAKVRMMCYL
jgi:septal ring factor EnvC (AmiA/AmiB activator)